MLFLKLILQSNKGTFKSLTALFLSTHSQSQLLNILTLGLKLGLVLRFTVRLPLQRGSPCKQLFYITVNIVF